VPNRRRLRLLLALGALVVLAVVVWAAIVLHHAEPGTPAPATPQLALYDLDGNLFTSDSLRGSFVVLAQGMSW